MVVVAGILIARRLAKRSYPPGYQKPALTVSKVVRIIGLAMAAIIACIFFVYGALLIAIGSGDSDAPKNFLIASYIGIPAIVLVFLYLANRVRRR